MRMLRRSNHELPFYLPIGLVAVGLLAFCPTATAQQRSLTTATGGKSTHDPMQEYVDAQRALFNDIYDSIPPEKRREWAERTGSPLMPPGSSTGDASISDQMKDLVDFQNRLYDNIYNSITPEMRKEWEEQVGTPLTPPRYPARSESPPRPASPGGESGPYYIRPAVGFGEDTTARLGIEGLASIALPHYWAWRVGLVFAGYECLEEFNEGVGRMYIDGQTEEGIEGFIEGVGEEVVEEGIEGLAGVAAGRVLGPLGPAIAFIAGQKAGRAYEEYAEGGRLVPHLAVVRVPPVRNLPLPAAVKALDEVYLYAGCQWLKTDKKDQHLKVFDQDPPAGRGVLVPSRVVLTVFWKSPKKGRTFTVPRVTKLPSTDAVMVIRRANLKAKGEGTNEGVPPGTRVREVFSQDPPPGTKLSDIGSTVSFLYHAGIKVPDVRGMSKKLARLKITELKLTPRTEVGKKQAPSGIDQDTVDKQDPVAGTRLALGDTVKIITFKIEEGFRVEDGEKVDPRFAKAKVTDGQAPGMEGPSAGKRTAIVYSQGGAGGEKARFGMAWQIRKYTDAAGPRAYLAKQVKDGFFSAKSISTPQATMTVRQRDVRGDRAIGTLDAVTQAGQLTSHVSIFIHKERFVILFTSVVPRAGHDFANESKRIIANSVSRIDERFPRD